MAPFSVDCDQAIFTSLRSPTGEGYRIVAASPGVSANERREITQRSPSHDSLCGAAPDTQALSAYPLASGRHAIALSQYAGREQSARGGQRVYTHVAVLEAADFRRFDCHPLPVCAALATAAIDPQLAPPSRLGTLALPVELPVAQDPGDLVEAVICLVDIILSGSRVVVVNAPRPFEMLRATFEALPLVVRRGLATSAGIKYSPSARMQLVVADLEEGEVLRLTRGQAVEVLDPRAPKARTGSPFAGWLELVGRMWAAGRHEELRGLTRELDQSASAHDLRAAAWRFERP